MVYISLNFKVKAEFMRQDDMQNNPCNCKASALIVWRSKRMPQAMAKVLVSCTSSISFFSRLKKNFYVR